MIRKVEMEASGAYSCNSFEIGSKTFLSNSGRLHNQSWVHQNDYRGNSPIPLSMASLIGSYGTKARELQLWVLFYFTCFRYGFQGLTNGWFHKHYLRATISDRDLKLESNLICVHF